jgi:FtsZ-interacting cell division protein YlmF
MKKYITIISSSLFLLLTACNNTDNQETAKSENDIDAARNFIRAALDGKFNEAKGFLFNDSSNTEYFDAYQRNYQKTEPEVKREYHEATINIHNVTQLNDSTTVVIYSNSYKNDHDTLKVLKKNDQWLVDLKYLFQHDADTMHTQAQNKTDTIK